MCNKSNSKFEVGSRFQYVIPNMAMTFLYKCVLGLKTCFIHISKDGIIAVYLQMIYHDDITLANQIQLSPSISEHPEC